MMFSVPVVIDRPEEVVALGAHLDRREHLGRQVVDHVFRLDRHLVEIAAVGHVERHEGALRVVRQVGFDDIADDDGFAVPDETCSQVSADETVAAVNHVFHREYSLA
jgi:hypothetical protein